MKGMGTGVGVRAAAAALLVGATLVAGAGVVSAHGRGGGAGAATAAGGSQHATAGDANAGDVWVDNTGQRSGPGHEQDPHLGCADITIWGAGLADGGGGFTIDSIPPSGGGQAVYTGTWTYDVAAGGTQAIAEVPVTSLVNSAAAAGAAPVNRNGYHFKLDLAQDPQKHKTFWVSCPAAAGGSGRTGSTASGPGKVGAATGVAATGSPVAPAGTAATAASPGSSTAGAAAGTTAAAGGVEALAATAPAPGTATPQAAGGVLGVSTSVPATGAALAAGLALALVAAGLSLVGLSRRRATAR